MIDQNIFQDTVYQKDQLFSTSWLNFLNKEICFLLFFDDFFFVPMCQVFWHMGTGQRAVPLEPALSHPLFFLTFSLSAQYVRHFAPISSNLGSEPTKLTGLFPVTFNTCTFLKLFFQKKKKNSL